MSNCSCPLHSGLRAIFNRRTADRVSIALAEIGIARCADFNGKRIPAHHASDLTHGSSPGTIARFERFLVKHGAAIVR